MAETLPLNSAGVANFCHSNADAQAAWNGVQNVWYTRGINGEESLSIFVKGKIGSESSWLYEFDLHLVPQDLLNGSTPSDAAFATLIRARRVRSRPMRQEAFAPLATRRVEARGWW